ncbi:MAG: hypothetical protein QW468_04405 [Candidatus Bathyarchaeia archaeon]
MQIKIDGKILTWLLIGMLIGVLIPLSIFYVNNTALKTEDASEEGNTTIISVYREYRMVEPVYGVEQYEIPYWYYLDVEHRIYPESITVQPHSKVTLGIEYTCNILGQGDWNVQPSDNVKLIVEVPRMPSNCSIDSFLDTLSDSGNREFSVTIEFINPNNAEWNVGRPLVKVLNMQLGNSSASEMPEVEVIIETSMHTYPLT